MNRVKNQNKEIDELFGEVDLQVRPRRNRKSESIRSLVRETILKPEQLIYPLFIHDNKHDEDIVSMPGCKRWSINSILGEIERSIQVNIGSIMLFPAIDDSLKSPTGKESFNNNGLVQLAIKKIKREFPEISVITDIALDPYSSDGHDGIVSPDGKILNDETVSILCLQALSHARAGVDIVSPSDMMDGRVGAIRNALDEEGYENVSILSYTAKYASALYGPFRGALDSLPRFGDKKTYQMDPANSREALRELYLDELEGADIVMVKPASHYLDVIKMFRENTNLPIAAYQVSGEYLMIKSASATGWLDEDKVLLESLTSIKRAGADMIVTYFARDAATLLSKR